MNNFTTTKVECVTAMINNKFIYFSTVQINYMIFHIYLYSFASFTFYRYITNSQSDQLPVACYRRGYGFESCSGLNYFQALISQLLRSGV